MKSDTKNIKEQLQQFKPKKVRSPLFWADSILFHLVLNPLFSSIFYLLFYFVFFNKSENVWFDFVVLIVLNIVSVIAGFLTAFAFLTLLTKRYKQKDLTDLIKFESSGFFRTLLTWLLDALLGAFFVLEYLQKLAVFVSTKNAITGFSEVDLFINFVGLWILYKFILGLIAYILSLIVLNSPLLSASVLVIIAIAIIWFLDSINLWDVLGLYNPG